jgi:amidase
VHDPLGACCRHVELTVDGAPDGPLAGLTFVAKDLFDVVGHRCCAGNPDWLRTHEPAVETAPAVARLLDAGATLVGKSLTDEFAYSILGSNHWYGTPRNPADPERLTGGSSCGSAVAVASGLVSCGLGTDTGGSVRVPAAWCGVFGMRPTHGAIDLRATFPLAPSIDTAGWFAADADTFRRVGEVLLPRRRDGEEVAAASSSSGAPTTVLGARDVLEATESEIVRRLTAMLRQLPWAPPRPVAVSDEPLAALAEAFRVLQAVELRETHGAWFRRVSPSIGPGVRERVDAVWGVTDDEWRAARRRRVAHAERMRALLDPGTVLVLPTVPVFAPRRDASDAELGAVRPRVLELTAIASLAGLPQVTVPAPGTPPVGLSLVAAPGEDRWLLRLAGLVAEAATRA